MTCIIGRAGVCGAWPIAVFLVCHGNNNNNNNRQYLNNMGMDNTSADAQAPLERPKRGGNVIMWWHD